MPDVVALGELLIDFACRETDAAGYPVLKANPGGAPGNFLAALTKYGLKTAMIGKVGGDAFGKLLIHTLTDLGIDARGVILDENVFTTLAFVTLDARGDRAFSFARKPGADTRLSPEEIDESLIAGCRAFHFGTLSLTDEPAKSATVRAVELARAHGKLISADPNLRKPLWKSEDAAREAMLWCVNQADIVKISDEEIDFLWGLSPEAGVDKLLREARASLVYATLGAQGCLAATKRCRARVRPPEGISPVDTTGAGDIFGGAAMSRFLLLNKPADALTEGELCEIARFACTAASLSTQAYGGISSVPDEACVRRALAR